jgi:gliding motility-associated-like protein
VTCNVKVFFSLLLALCLIVNSMKSQTCNGSLGDPVVNNDFGRGNANYGPALINSATYNFVGSGTPPDGSYAITKTTAGMHVGNWHQIKNHTADDPDGYMMIVNADEDPGIFYEAEVPVDLCANTTYEFAAWVINLLTYNGKKPNLTFSILTLDNQLLATPYNTGDIPEGSATDWKQYGFLFSTTGNMNRVKIRISNNGPGGNGNDIALDDITFRACGPELTPSVDNMVLSTQYLCEGGRKDYNFKVEVNGSSTLQYQWQLNAGTGWNDIPEENSTHLFVRFDPAVKGIYQYRLAAAEPANFDSPSCRTLSPPITIQVNALPMPILPATATFCLGKQISLQLTGVIDGTYLWTGPNGFNSTDQSPVINNATAQMQGLYKVKVTSPANCVAESQIFISVIPPPVAAVEASKYEICEGEQVSLNAWGGTIFKWLPEAGLSSATIAHPVASPKTTTLYQVMVSNGACTDLAEVEVVVYKNPTASAGEDKKIFEGEHMTLQGNVSGDGVSFFWSPETGLDDPYKLNPVASPTADITYTLNAISNRCTNALDRVFIRVYQHVTVPNSFSPNEDGTNDLWNLPAINSYPGATVKVMNRYGKLVFQSSGYEKPWNGKYQNQDVPVGVYYYMINLEPGLKPLTGSLMLIR